jgi:hypothetical protein
VSLWTEKEEICLGGTMKYLKFVRIAVMLSLLAGAAAVYAQEGHEEDKDKPATKPAEESPKPQEPKKEEPKEAKPPQSEDKHADQEKQKRDDHDADQTREDQKKEDQQKEDQQKKQDQQQKEDQKKQSQTDKNNADQAKESQDRDRNQARNDHHGDANRGARIPDDRFHANFGREHRFAVNRPVIVENRPRFQYSGFWFELSDPWPSDWAYSDECYIDFVDDQYFLFDPVHPGVRIAIFVVEG